MLLKTRFYLPPQRAGAVKRDHLLQQLQASGGGSLVLVSAPAGYGKTTLVSQWLHQYPQTFAWLTLDSEHNVIGVFWDYFLAALRQMVPELGREAEQLWLAAETPDYQQLLVSLLNDLDQFSINNRARDPLTLVLDDFHLLHNPRLLQWINRLLDHLPACLRIVITARGEPDLALSRRRASGQLVSFGIYELRFSTEEAHAFFADLLAAGSNAREVESLCERAEGWIAGLQLAALSVRHLQGNVTALLGSEGLDRNVADYLLDEVFAGLPIHLQTFLQHTAVAKRFCAGLANAIDDRDDSMSVLLELESLNLFLVPLDNHRTWYRYHELFRQFLWQRFGVLGESTKKEILQRALDWLEQNGYWDDAIELALDGANWDAALRLLQSYMHGSQPLEVDQEKMQQWLKRMPPDSLALVPALQQLAGQHVVSKVDSPDMVTADQVEPLTRQEKVVLDLIGQGLSNKAIARELQISLNTLKVHIRNLYGKIGVENRTQVLLKIKGDS